MIAILLGGKDDVGKFKIFAVFADGSVLVDKYQVSGSGMELALATLDNEWKAEMTEQGATALAVKAINVAIKRDVFTGNGIDVAVIDAKGFRKINENKIAAIAK